MAKLSLSLLLFFFFIFCINIGTVEPLSRAAHSQARAFVEASCRTTRYPALCVKWLTCHASSNTPPTAQQLTRTALTVNLYRARHVRLYLVKVAKELKATKAKEYPVVRDCLVEIDDSVSQLSQSVGELCRLDPKAEMMSAMTFIGQRMSKMKATIKSKVLNVAQLTSNALALFHRYAAAAIEKHP
ncbi:pectinesterase inhibitor 9-like [Gossypium hirsutum]|uniref:Pectinesterase inhibitor 9-like n=1 Tax=Gossypium hirsutum TaxID=3635 RepID=A0ABM2YN38_GOSHI|nr:pectinesterase inhibitor 9-like [Gossypium hirsutum]